MRLFANPSYILVLSYEAIKDDGPDLKEFSNGRPLQSNNGLLHTDQYRARQLDYKIGMI